MQIVFSNYVPLNTLVKSVGLPNINTVFWTVMNLNCTVRITTTWSYFAKEDFCRIRCAVVRGGDNTYNKANKSFSCHSTETPLLLSPQRTPTRRHQNTISGRAVQGSACGTEVSFWASACLSDSSGSTPLLDPRFSPSSPPTVRSNRQGRGVWADMLGAGSVLRLLVSNASTATTPSTPTPPHPQTHTHTSRSLKEMGHRWRGRRSCCDLAHPTGQLET